MQFVLRLFGSEVVAIGIGEPEPEYPILDGISGGSAQNFERDVYPPDPSGEEPWVDKNKFGFG